MGKRRYRWLSASCLLLALVAGIVALAFPIWTIFTGAGEGAFEFEGVLLIAVTAALICALISGSE